MRSAIVLCALLIAGCATDKPAPQLQYKTELVDTSCQRFKVILIPKGDLDRISDDLKAQILSHDRAWVAACRK